ncbi:MAG: hypothetical protein B6I20_09655 [Bacteroidetes bacterium 4572_117]|nr:MAG: hypothetical protein B6I20_09655 [Bacteroidetes bacterium 4572_117]
MINILRVVISAIIGYWLSVELALEGFIRFVFFFGIFIVVSIIIEIIRKLLGRSDFSDRKNKS